MNRVNAHLRAGLAARDGALRVGPFQAGIDPVNAGPYHSYAVPDDDDDPSRGEVAALTAAFVAGGRLPRLEYAPAGAPRVEAAMLAAGWTVEARPALMTATSFTVAGSRAQPGGLIVRLAETRTQHDDASAAQDLVFGPGGLTGDQLHTQITSRGGAIAVAYAADGTPAGAGVLTVPAAGTAEVAAIGVLPAHRRRGLATALTALLAREGLRGRGLSSVFLTPDDAGARAAYERAGFRADGAVLHLRSPRPPRRPAAPSGGA